MFVCFTGDRLIVSYNGENKFNGRSWMIFHQPASQLHLIPPFIHSPASWVRGSYTSSSLPPCPPWPVTNCAPYPVSFSKVSIWPCLAYERGTVVPLSLNYCCPIHKRCWHIVQEFKRPLAKTNFLCKLWNYCVKFLHTVSKCSRQVSTCESQTTLTQSWHLDVNFTLARCRQPPPSSATTPSWPFIFSVQVFS